MSDPFLGEIRLGAFAFAPKGWALCNGQVLAINLNQALFALLGTTYGGNGQTTFALPDLRNRVPLHFGAGFVIGETGGEATHVLTQAEMPAHNHGLTATSAAATQSTPIGHVPAVAGKPTYATGSPDTTMDPGAVSPAGGNQPHENMPPYLVLNFIIALQGIFPSRS